MSDIVVVNTHFLDFIYKYRVGMKFLAPFGAGLVRVGILGVGLGRDIAGSQGDNRTVPLYSQTVFCVTR